MLKSYGGKDKRQDRVEVGWLEFNVPFQHKYGYIRDERHRGNTNANVAGDIFS